MPLVLETGSGVRGANSYVLPAFVTTYLTDRGREAENNWTTAGAPAQEQGCIAATDYIDKRWGRRFLGTRLGVLKGLNARAQVTLTGEPAPADTFSLDNRTYTLVSSLTLLGVDEVLLGGTADATALNLIAAINGEPGGGTVYTENMFENDAATAALVEGTTDSLLLTAAQEGEAGNDIPVSAASAAITVDSVFVGGLSSGSQPLEFPRRSLVDQDGRRIYGIPEKLRQATAEYAVRHLGATLLKDPTVDATGRTVVEKFEKLGPIESRTRYEEGGALSRLITPYPAADQLLADYVRPSGLVVRG